MGRNKSPAATIKENILLLNNALPDEVSRYWVTTEELRDRLVHSGVSVSLTLDLVSDAVRRYNKNDEKLKVWRYADVNYYRSTVAHVNDKQNTESPLESRYKPEDGKQGGKKFTTGRPNRLDINPQRDYFKNCNNARLTTINNALDELEQQQSTRAREETRGRFISVMLSSITFAEVTVLTLLLQMIRQQLQQKLACRPIHQCNHHGKRQPARDADSKVTLHLNAKCHQEGSEERQSWSTSAMKIWPVLLRMT